MNKELQDKAWSVLPKEFKEEVKKLYREFAFTREGYYVELFGLHNLTSDAEGEEMLTVPRKDIIELYQEVQKTISQCKGTELAMQAIGIKNVIWSFFGSKCQPDDADSSEKKENRCEKCGVPNSSICAHINCQNFPSQSEPKLAEPKEAARMKPIKAKVSVYLATAEEDEEFRQLLHENGFKWSSNRSLISLSCWLSVLEKGKIHNVYPDKTVTYYGDKTSDTLTFSGFKKQYFGEESRNLLQETANCDKHFDNILKDSFSKERRLNIATQILSGIVASPKPCKHPVKRALELADALLAECEKGGSDEKD